MSIAIDNRSWRSPNFDSRGGARIEALLIHTGEGTRKSDLETLTKPRGTKSVSSHYYVCRDATVYQLVDDKDNAWHAGTSFYLGRSNWNLFSLGIETEHKQGQNWPGIQLDALGDLCRIKIQEYRIIQQMVASHRDVAPGRKIDPTNWPDSEFKPWVASLYSTAPVDERQAAWGSIPVNWTWGIPKLWDRERLDGRYLGKAVTPEVYPVPGYSAQYFELGSVNYRVRDGKLTVDRWD